MSDYKVTDSELTSIANAIRTKGGTSSPLVFPNGFTSAIGAIPTGGGGVIQTLSVTANGTYNPPSGVDGYAPVVVNVSGGGGGSVLEVDTSPEEEDMANGNVQILYLLNAESSVDEKPTAQTPVAGIAGQNQSSAITALNATGNNPGDDYNWTTGNNNYNNMWVGADFGEPVALNTLIVAPRTFNGGRQIYTIIFEASNDLTDWVLLGKTLAKGDDIPHAKWYKLITGNTTPYRYYRLRTTIDPATGKVNRSVTFTIYGLGFLNDTAALTKKYVKAFYKINDELHSFSSDQI